jgi:hypothetical protein
MWLATILQVKDIASSIKQFKAEERKSLGMLFLKTAMLIEDIAADFEKHYYPISKTATLETLAESVTINLVRIARRNKVEDVIEAYKPFISLKEEWEKRKEEGAIDNLYRIAGELRGLGILFRI